MTSGRRLSKLLQLVLACAMLTSGAPLVLAPAANGNASPSAVPRTTASPSATPGPVTVALRNVVVVHGSRATLAYRVDDPASATATVTLVIAGAGGAVVSSSTLPSPMPTGKDLAYAFRCDLAPGTYRLHVEAVDEAGLTQTSATSARLRVLPIFPQRKAIDAAIGWLRQRHSAAGLAVIDDRGRATGYRLDAQFASGSVVKAMLLVRYLRTHTSIDRVTRATLARMIIVSDNTAASAVYRVVGDRGLRDCAVLVGMTHFALHGNWALARITALDQARLFYAMDSFVPSRYRPWVRYLFSHITPAHRWGVPQVTTPAGWKIFFKGGYMPVGGGIVVHEACRLNKDGVVFSLVVLTGGSRSQAYGAATLRGVAARVLGVRTAR